MGGQRPKSAMMLDAEVRQKGEQEIDGRFEAEPIYESQNFIVPSELDDDEVKKWNEVVALVRAIENHPLSDAHRDKMIQYCQVWVRRNVLVPLNKAEPLNKDIANMLAKYDMLLRGLSTDLCLDIVSQARVGKARNDFKRKKADPIGDIRNRQGD